MAQNRRIAKRYAKAFLHEKANREKIDLLAEEFNALVNVFDNDPSLLEFFVTPAAPKSSKVKAAGNIMEKLGFSSYTRSLFELLIKKDRIAIIDAIAEELRDISDHLNDRIRVKVTTAVEPSVSDLDVMAERIGKYFGKNAAVEREIDSSIIGGFVLEGDGKMVDLSIKGQLKRILTKV